MKAFKGLYIHIPFCKSKCIYCDFLSFSSDEKVDEYLKSLVFEARFYEGEKIFTLFIGGGTPSLLNVKQLRFLISGISKIFDFSELEEFTIEANPESLDAQKIEFLTDNEFLKVTRFSLGLQAFDDEILQKIGRLYTYKFFTQKLKELRDFGAKNINVDLIAGWNFGGYNKAFLKKFDEFLGKFYPEHLSLYLLTIAENTKLQDMICSEKYMELDPDSMIDLFHASLDLLKSKNYSHYEISNFARNGNFCKHNLGYWKRRDYIGLGLGSSGFLQGVRYKNPNFFPDYFEMVRSKNFEKYREIEVLSEKENFEEYVMLGLRLLYVGIDLDFIRENFTINFEKFYEKIRFFENEKYLIRQKNKILMTEKGICLQNSLLTEILEI